MSLDYSYMEKEPKHRS